MDCIIKLQETKKRTLQYYDLSAEDLDKCYADGKWNIRKLLNHLADAESVLYDRIRRVIAEPRQVIWNFDQDAWADGLEYNRFPVAINKRIYSSIRDAVIYLAEEYYESHGAYEFVHSESGVRTLKDEFDKIASHNEHHLEQIEAALKR